MNQSNFQSLINNSIRQEIQRFESVHPSIYAIYALIGHINDLEIADQIQKHIVCIEDSFVNSQEWTISRAVNDFRIGIVGTSHSGKSALVHRYLTGSFMQEDSPEGGRFKKEISIENQSYMLLIRDEGGAPEFQFAAWVDAIIFVFSLENESSYNAIYNYFTLMSNLRQDFDIPILLVGTQDAISEMYPRVIDDSKARKLANDLKKCSYYETCAVYGLNVDRVFQDACSKILQHRMMKQSSTIVTTNNFRTMEVNEKLLNYMNGGVVENSPQKSTVNNNSPVQKNAKTLTMPQKSRSGYNACSKKISDLLKNDEPTIFSTGIRDAKSEIPGLSSPGQLPIILYDNFQQMDIQLREKEPHLTPSSTPTAARKSRRRSNLFIPTKKNDEKLKGNCELGSGRKIPIKQGYLYKKSSKSLNKEWKKKYVTLCDGCLSYYPSLHDYMDDIHGKDVDLHYVTVKVPGQKPRGSKSIITNSALTKKKVQTCLGISNLIMSENKKDKDVFGDSNGRSSVNSRTSGDEVSLLNAAGSNSQLGSDEYVDNKILTETQTSTNAKKRHRRMKSSGVKNGDAEDQDGFEFFIVAIDNKQWQFEAANSEERNEWVELIDKEIFKSLQTNESSKSDSNCVQLMQSIKTKVPGNDTCVDCSSPNPEWASLNLGILMCIECSGIHRNLGSHISKVRSLGLDEWPPSHLWVMLSIGNSLANNIWEHNTHGKKKPVPSSSREDKEKWIKSKYESKSFLPICDFSTRRIEQQLVEAVADADMKAVILLLTYVTAENINCTVSSRDLRTPLHLACATGNLAMTQLLIWHHADIHLIDHEGRNVLSFAKVANQEALPEAKEITISLVEFLTNLGCSDPMDSGLLTNYRESNLEL